MDVLAFVITCPPLADWEMSRVKGRLLLTKSFCVVILLMVKRIFKMRNAFCLKVLLVSLLVVFSDTSCTKNRLISNSMENDSNKPVKLISLIGRDREVVFTLNPIRLEEEGLTVKQLEFVRRHQFYEGNYIINVGEKRIDLAKIASVKIRDLYAPPFEVTLPDGRKVLISPLVKRIKDYEVTGEYFEQNVRRILADPFETNIYEAIVLSGISIAGGPGPASITESGAEISGGEPLKTFADIKIYGEPGPQAKDLEHMCRVRHWVDEGIKLANGVSRDIFEKAFGKGTPDDAAPDPDFGMPIPSWTYYLEKGRFQAWFDEETKTVDDIALVVNSDMPWGNDPNIRKLAREFADTERETIIIFLKKLYGPKGVAISEDLKQFLKQSARDMEWRAEELKVILQKSQ